MSSKHRALVAMSMSTLLMVVAACGDSGPERADVVSAMTDSAVAERYEQVATSAATLRANLDEWCETGAVDGVNAAMTEVRAGWSALVPFWFGPVQDRRSVFIVDPRVNTADIDELVVSDEPLDATSLRELAGADERGLGAIEHLILADPTDRSCAYVTGAADLVVEETSELAAEWVTSGPPLAADDESANDALRDIVSSALSAVQKADMEPGTPSAEAYLDGARWVLIGDGGSGGVAFTGIASLLSAATVEQLTAELDAADAMALERTITTQVAGELGISVNFSDADGDA